MVSECIDPSRINDIIDELKIIADRILGIIEHSRYIDSIDFVVKVCSNIPDHYWLVKLRINNENG